MFYQMRDINSKGREYNMVYNRRSSLNALLVLPDSGRVIKGLLYEMTS